MAMKVPGVYTVEKNAFPNSVVEVATAVPAFIGYTARAEDGAASLTRKPWRITSMAEYEHHFGGAPEPVFTIAALPPGTPGTPATQPDMAAARGQEAVFRLGSQDYRLTRAAGRAGGRYLMHQGLRHFFQNGGGTCYIVSVGRHGDEIAAGDAHGGLVGGLVGGLAALLSEQEPTLVVAPDAVLLSRLDCAAVQTALIAHCGHDTRSRFGILDVWGGELSRQYANGDCVDAFRADIGNDCLDFAAAYYPWLHTSVVAADEIDHGVIGNRAELARLIGLELALADAAAGDTKAAAVQALLVELAGSGGRGGGAWENRLDPAVTLRRRLLDQSLRAVSPLYGRVLDEARVLVNVMPPSSALAGLYTMVDNTRGVWKAPANISVNGAVAPTVDLSQADQEDLNATISGKSVNAIRSFIGEGTLVWGARTLDGNSLDWRYVNVRRTMIMLEESCRLAVRAMVFEPNVSNTWATVESMLQNFLTGIWKRGGLAGAVPEDAFSVQVGLGRTMTPEDILKGILRVTVLVAIVRPAEFIEITFQQQMPVP